RGNGCPMCRSINLSRLYSHTTEYFIERAKQIHGNKFDYSLVDYKNNNTKIKIICDNGHIFEQLPSNHLNKFGCFKCDGKNKNTEDFIKSALKKHGNKYDYRLVKYQNNRTKVKIICPIHNVFEQRPTSHLSGQGCPKCGRVRFVENTSSLSLSWSATNWEKSAKMSKYFDSFKVYIIRCWNNEEEFYKIG